MTDLEKKIELFIKEIVANHFDIEKNGNAYFDKYRLAKYIKQFTQQETELLSKHILELQKTNCALTDKVNELEKRFEPQAFTEVISEVEENYNNEVRLAEATEIIKEFIKLTPIVFIGTTTEVENIIAKAEAFINKE